MTNHQAPDPGPPTPTNRGHTIVTTITLWVLGWPLAAITIDEPEPADDTDLDVVNDINLVQFDRPDQ